jgi:hypothetical protein
MSCPAPHIGVLDGTGMFQSSVLLPFYWWHYWSPKLWQNFLIFSYSCIPSQLTSGVRGQDGLGSAQTCQSQSDVLLELGFLDVLHAKVDLENCLCYHILISYPNGKLTFDRFLATTVLTRGTCVTYICPNSLGFCWWREGRCLMNESVDVDALCSFYLKILSPCISEKTCFLGWLPSNHHLKHNEQF